MGWFRALPALLLCAAAAQAEQVESLIDRPLTLPKGRVDVTAHAVYTNWELLGTSVDGLSLAMGVDFGVTDKTQAGIAVALPITPGAGFGSVLGTAVFQGNPLAAIRLDGGYEQFGFNGGSPLSGGNHANRFFGGIGLPIKAPITPTVAFVSGRTSAVQFGHFNNVGAGGVGLYSGASEFTENASDVFTISGGDSGTTTIYGIHVPLGLLLQPDPHLALTLETGYSAVINSSGSLHFVPLAFEAVVTPVSGLDIIARFVVDGYVAGDGGFSYFDLRALMFWIRLRV